MTGWGEGGGGDSGFNVKGMCEGFFGDLTFLIPGFFGVRTYLASIFGGGLNEVRIFWGIIQQCKDLWYRTVAKH